MLGFYACAPAAPERSFGAVPAGPGERQTKNLTLDFLGFFLPQELPRNSLALHRAFVTEGTPVHQGLLHPLPSTGHYTTR